MNIVRIKLQVPNVVATLLILAVFVSPAISQQQTSAFAAPSTACVSVSDPNAVWDGYSMYPNCTFVCKEGYHFDANGTCVPNAAAVPIGQTGNKTPAVTSAQAGKPGTVIDDTTARAVISKLVPDLANSDPDTRINAVLALAATKNDQAVQPLADVLMKDKNDNVRYNAAIALGIIGSDQAVTSLVNALKNEQIDQVRNGIAVALAGSGNDQTITLLVEALKNSQDRDLREAAVAILGKIGSTKVLPHRRYRN